jgi:formate dehydrogenase gamma subunit
MRVGRTLVALGFLALAAAGLAGGGPRAASAAGADDDVCMMCHADRDLRAADDASLHVDEGTLRGSAHRDVACASCHTTATVPHPDRIAPVRCASCHAEERRELAASAHAEDGNGHARTCVSCHGTHDVRPAASMGRDRCATCHGEVVSRYEESVHGVALAKGDGDVSTCRDCHGSTHSVRSHTDPESPTSHANVAGTCAQCHADRELVTRRKITIPEAMALYERSVHGRSADPKAATCTDCHESHHLLRAGDPRSSIYRTNIPNTCGRCHAAENEAYQVGVHGTALERGVMASPVCTDCHGEHLIRGPRDPDSPVAAGMISKTCSHCHEAERIRETFGLPAGRLSTYEDSYHGLAARGGSPVAADCASCHGFHDILPSSDARSAVHPANLPATCGSCHPGAGARFAEGRVHVAMSRPDNAILRWVRLTYIALIIGTIGGMFAHNVLDFAKKLRESLGRHLGSAAAHAAQVTQRYVERLTVGERIQHALLAGSFVTLVFTGFALTYPEALPFAWLARLEGGYAWRGQVHRWAAVVMIGVSLFHVAYLFTRRGRQMLVAMLPGLKDVREAGQNLAYLAGRRSEPPKFDHFGYIEKAEYWALIWGTVVMSVTGLALWFENESLQYVNKWVLDLATMVHFYEAWLAFLAIIVWHMYYVIVNPEIYPMNWTWLTGRISEDQLRHEHRGEWERLFGGGDADGGGGGGDTESAPQAGAEAERPEEQTRPEDGARPGAGPAGEPPGHPAG